MKKKIVYSDEPLGDMEGEIGVRFQLFESNCRFPSVEWSLFAMDVDVISAQ